MDPIVGQLAVPVPRDAAHNPETPCAWCGETPTELFEVEKPRYRTRMAGGKQLRLMARRAVTAPACRECTNRFHRDAEARAERRKRELDPMAPA